ncbi:formiminotetrahydrofolate cyclodeaminase [Agrococcus sp. UYP10]|uniref:cyclodeaminase/cyclohydrolase family protein n=1 Tax=Agrococcus sp. UYP10 TaxID=1756355 RepID=UPI0033944A54
MSDSVWSLRADELLRRTASSEPTPGNGSIAAVAGAFGIALVLMALTITEDAPASLRERGEAILERVTPAADADVAAFGAVIDASGGGGDDAALESATVAATERPLELLAALVDALALAAEAEPVVKHALVSDVLSGGDLIAGAARAAIRAADLNLATLERDGSDASAALRERRETLVSALDDALGARA